MGELLRKMSMGIQQGIIMGSVEGSLELYSLLRYFWGYGKKIDIVMSTIEKEYLSFKGTKCIVIVIFHL
jgi:hypothetical protein